MQTKGCCREFIWKEQSSLIRGGSVRVGLLLVYLALLCEMRKGALWRYTSLWHKVGPEESVLGKSHTSVSSLVGREKEAPFIPCVGILSSAQAAPLIQWAYAQTAECSWGHFARGPWGWELGSWLVCSVVHKSIFRCEKRLAQLSCLHFSPDLPGASSV